MLQASILTTALSLAALGGCSKTSSVTRLDAGGGFQFIVSAANEWEVNCPYYYEVRHNGATVVPLTFLGAAGAPSGAAFETRATADRRLVAIVESSAPDIVLAMFDTSSRQTWPRAGDTEHHTTVHERGLTLLSRLQQSYPDMKFVLSDDVAGSRSTKL